MSELRRWGRQTHTLTLKNREGVVEPIESGMDIRFY